MVLQNEENLKKAKWKFQSDYSDVLVIHTLVVQISINRILERIYEDYATIRRASIEYGFIDEYKNPILAIPIGIEIEMDAGKRTIPFVQDWI